MAETVDAMADTLSRLYLTDKVAFCMEQPESEYVLHLDAQNPATFGSSAKLAATSSNFMVRIYTADSLTFSASIHAHDQSISGVRFSPTDANILYTSSADGSIRGWDMRTKCEKAAQIFETFADTLNTLTCLDVNCDGTLLGAGTEATESNDVQVLLWDVRRGKTPSRRLEDSHTDDVTQVRFHPKIAEAMLSGSTDGLVNYYDLTETNEDDVISGTMNTESSVSRLGFCGKDDDYIYALTHIETVHLWKSVEDFDDVACVSDIREKYADNGVDYLVDCFHCDWLQNQVCILAGSSSGQGQIMSLQGDELKPEFTMSDGHSDVIRSVTWCSGPTPTLVTGGEDGMLCAWSQTEAKKSESPGKDKRKSKSELKSKVKHKVRGSAKPF